MDLERRSGLEEIIFRNTLLKLLSFDWRGVCRAVLAAWIAVTSLAIGYYIFGHTVQGADLFLEPTTGVKGVGFWVVFLGLAVGVWSIPLYICVKTTLTEWNASTLRDRQITSTTLELVSKSVAVAAIATVVVGEYRAFAGVLDSTVGLTYEESLFGLGYEDDTSWFIVNNAPKLIFLAVAAIGFAIGAILAGKRRTALRLGGGGLLLAIFAIGALAGVTWVPDKSVVDLVLRAAVVGGDYATWPLLVLAVPTTALIPLLWRHAPRVAETGADLKLAFHRYLIGSLIIIGFLVLLNPNHVGNWLVRAQLVPVLLGMWLPSLTALRVQSIRRRVPILLFAVFVLMTFASLVGDGHDIRRLAKEISTLNARPTLEQSLDRWAAVNDCEIGAEKSEKRCPPPILVAAAGGASRSAFYVGTILGELIDLTEKAPVPSQRFSHRLFAVSGVSGGATGLAFHRAALAEAFLRREGKNSLTPPCDTTRLENDSLFFAPSSYGHAAKIAVREAEENEDERARAAAVDPEHWKRTWRGCLQALAAGDFLSPVLLSMVFHDALQLSFAKPDRAVALESGWEDRFLNLVGVDWMSRDFLELRLLSQHADHDLWVPLGTVKLT